MADTFNYGGGFAETPEQYKARQLAAQQAQDSVYARYAAENAAAAAKKPAASNQQQPAASVYAPSSPGFTAGTQNFTAAQGAFGLGGDSSQVLSVTPNGGGGGGGGVDSMAALQAMQDAQSQANSANEARYQQVLGLADQYGTTQKQGIRRQAANAAGGAQQSLISRGLGSSTVVDTMQAGIQRNKQQALAGVNEQKAMMKANIIQNRTDQQPNLPLYAQLMSRPGATTGPVATVWDPSNPNQRNFNGMYGA